MRLLELVVLDVHFLVRRVLSVDLLFRDITIWVPGRKHAKGPKVRSALFRRGVYRTVAHILPMATG